jgi:hypothetical protein
VRDLAAKIGNFEFVDLLGAAFAFEQTLPRRFDAATERRYHPQPGDDNATHLSGILFEARADTDAARALRSPA